MKSVAVAMALGILFANGSAFADEPPAAPEVAPPAIPSAVDMEEESTDAVPLPFRVNVTGALGFGNYIRTVTSPQNESGFALSGELRIHPHSSSGVVFALGDGGALGGPTVSTVDVAYSFRPFSPEKLKGLTGALYLDLGPSLGFVQPTGNQVFHHDLGGRAGVALDVQIYNVTLGAQFVFHGGFPIDPTTASPSQWESFYTLGLRAGVAFDAGIPATSGL